MNQRLEDEETTTPPCLPSTTGFTGSRLPSFSHLLRRIQKDPYPSKPPLGALNLSTLQLHSKDPSYLLSPTRAINKDQSQTRSTAKACHRKATGSRDRPSVRRFMPCLVRRMEPKASSCPTELCHRDTPSSSSDI